MECYNFDLYKYGKKHIICKQQKKSYNTSQIFVVAYSFPFKYILIIITFYSNHQPIRKQDIHLNKSEILMNIINTGNILVTTNVGPDR